MVLFREVDGEQNWECLGWAVVHWTVHVLRTHESTTPLLKRVSYLYCTSYCSTICTGLQGSLASPSPQPRGCCHAVNSAAYLQYLEVASNVTSLPTRWCPIQFGKFGSPPHPRIPRSECSTPADHSQRVALRNGVRKILEDPVGNIHTTSQFNITVLY
jgi:hypothetical protein